jgi:biopolymer transport protein ExbB
VIRAFRIVVGVALAALVGGATQANAAGTLEELLQETKTARARAAQANAGREKEFVAKRDQQAALLAQARKDRDAAQARSQDLSSQFDANEVKLTELGDLRNARLGSLGELFGVVRQASTDVSSVVYDSMISAQFPGRDEFFTKLSATQTLPSIKELEQLWFAMQREMTETGRVARFQTNVVTEDGSSQQEAVVRIGAFTAVASGGRYLVYLPAVRTMSVLPRQPGSELRELATGVFDAQSGYVEAAVDPSRGILLSLFVQRPNLWERIQHGEAVGYVIIVVGIIGALCAVFQFLYLLRARAAVNRQLKNTDVPRSDNPLGRVLAAFKGDPNAIEEDAEIVELRISEAVLREVPLLERFQAFLRLAVAAGPLLGLFGTVVGMIVTFQSITESGSSDPKLMANGIGQAMIATVLGLGIAVPLLFVNAGLTSLSKSIVQVLDEQSAGLLAESLERAKNRDLDDDDGLLGGRSPRRA